MLNFFEEMLNFFDEKLNTEDCPVMNMQIKLKSKLFKGFPFPRTKKKQMKMQIKLKSKLFKVFLIQNTKIQG